ncbi:branched-chain amino acid ABC transporter substrate-binding protein [Janibacter sp. Soil728]|uniref:ABC transporter substrate-binding protein n=1 Tax=Janibacter sp. Soil728 TaxID=1736393 RepID=UPI0006FF5712|nr:ABC transporter substrate-binding protein [Janibacter sp. Soil728]KRE37859.1 branched-chain amino acid ABC transporter substrate-binding protein [Janibacter sp. Soil728]
MSARTRSLAAMAAASGLLLTACGGNSSDGAASDQPIKIGIIADLTGATGDVGAPYNDGMKAYIDWRNSDGGIEGRQIEALSNDYAYEVPKAESLYKQYLNDEVVAIQGWGTGDTEALSASVGNDELPFMSGSFAEPLTNPEEAPYNFVVAPTYSDQMRVALNWIAEDAGGKGEVAVFHNDSPFGTAPVEDGKKWISEKKLDLGYEAYAMPGGKQNYVGLLAQAKKQGAKYIVIQNVASPAALVAKDIAAQKLDMKIVCLNWCANELFIDSAGAKVAEGHLLIQPFAPMSADKEGHKVITDYIKAKGIDEKKVGTSWVQGWYAMDIMAGGIEKTLKDGDDLTGANIRKALETMGGQDTGGVVGDGTVEFTAESHRGSSATGIYQAKGGKMVEVQAGATP